MLKFMSRYFVFGMGLTFSMIAPFSHDYNVAHYADSEWGGLIIGVGWLIAGAIIVLATRTGGDA